MRRSSKSCYAFEIHVVLQPSLDFLDQVLRDYFHFRYPHLSFSRKIPSGARQARRNVWILALIMLGVTSAGRPMPMDNPRLSEYQKHDWQVEDGLPENNVRMIAQRPDGTLLIATSSGIDSFDGLHFYPLPRNGSSKGSSLRDNEAVNAILPVGKDDLWIGTDGRGVLHQTASGTVNISEQAGHFNERIRMLHMDSGGVLWIATQNGVERYSHNHLDAITEAGMISGDITTPFADDGYGGMFFVTSSGLFHWRNGVAESYSLKLAKSDLPVAVYRDEKQRIWVGTTAHLVQLIPRAAETQSLPPQFNPQVRAAIKGPVSVLLGDASGNLWIGTRRDGLWRFTAGGLSRWTLHDGLPDNSIRSLFIDDEHNLWIGMLTGGLSRWRKGALAPYGDPEGFHATYSANVLADSHGDLWLGTWGKGLFRRHSGQLVPMTPPTMPIATPIRALAEDHHGQIWVGTWFDGVYRFDGHSFHHYLLGNESPGNAVSAILPDRVGGLWIGTYTGLIYFPSGQPEQQKRSQLLGSQLVTCLIQDRDGSILVGTSTGLYRVRNDVAVAVSGLEHSNILSLTLDSEGYAWAATKGGGLTAILQNHILPIPASAGLPDFSINTAIEDTDGHMWFGTARGIVRVSLTDLHAVADGRRNTLSSVILDRADGMRSSECGGPSKPGSARLPDGTLWFVTTRGFVHTTDVAEKVGATNPVAEVTGWTLSIDPNASDVIPALGVQRLDLEPGHSDILLFFNAKLLSNPAHIEFRYRLARYDAGWTLTRARAARYRRLPPGTYRFEVQARGSGEEWSSPVASLVIKQYPYIWQTWYFYVALVLVAAGITVQLFLRRVQLLKGRIGIVLEERNRISRECHDTLMAGFAAVSWQLEATAKLFRDNNSASTPPAESCELARSMVAHCQAEARRIIWDLRDTDEVTNILSHALTRTLSANVTPETIETTFDVDGDEVPLAPGCVHHLVCIGQEAVSNAIRHAHATHIMIQLKYESEALILSIRDDGCGFQYFDQASALGGHFGIPVMEERARKLGGTLRVLTSVGGGTEIEVKVSFNALQQPVSQEHHVIRWIGI
jgi:ligand-binding sensor domain-containing protein/signal transduction histidine kinase